MIQWHLYASLAEFTVYMSKISSQVLQKPRFYTLGEIRKNILFYTVYPSFYEIWQS